MSMVILVVLFTWSLFCALEKHIIPLTRISKSFSIELENNHEGAIYVTVTHIKKQVIANN